MAESTVWTIGHSTRPLDELIGLLRAHGIERLVDVRTVPRSRRHPQFASEALARSLPAAGIEYHHVAALGGLRKPSAASTNRGWHNDSFRGYADYMQTPAFEHGLQVLEALAVRPTAIMCAEAVWWRCHRQLIADALVARGHTVRHIMTVGAAEPHRLTSFARLTDGRVDYPPPLATGDSG